MLSHSLRHAYRLHAARWLVCGVLVRVSASWWFGQIIQQSFMLNRIQLSLLTRILKRKYVHNPNSFFFFSRVFCFWFVCLFVLPLYVCSFFTRVRSRRGRRWPFWANPPTRVGPPKCAPRSPPAISNSAEQEIHCAMQNTGSALLVAPLSQPNSKLPRLWVAAVYFCTQTSSASMFSFQRVCLDFLWFL